MNNCQDIQPELAAYVDGELTPPQRAEVDAHLASCPRCQQELAELKALAAGLAALPKRQPAPQFLADIRRKIARGDKPEAVTWQDYLFRPFWLKFPLEMAALIALIVFVMRFEEQTPANRAPQFEMSKAENSPSERHDTVPYRQLAATETAAKPQSIDESLQAPAVAPPSTVGDKKDANGTQPEPVSAPEAQILADRGTETPRTLAAGGGRGEERPVLGAWDGNGPRSSVASASSGFAGRRRVAEFHGDVGGLASNPAPATPDATVLARSLGIAPSKLGDVVIIDAKNPNDVRNLAERLAARCNGSILAAPLAKDDTGQVFFVELPREYAATFRLEMLQSARSSQALTNGIADGESNANANATAWSAGSIGTVAGVLTGRQETNVAFNSTDALALTNEVKARESRTIVLEIRVVTPAN